MRDKKMKTEKSIQAQVAALVRKELKSLNLAVKPKVTSESFAGGNAVDIQLVDPTPEQSEAVRKICNKYQSGSFNAMEDYYENSPVKKSHPTVKYVQQQAEYTQELRQSVYEYLIGRGLVIKTKDSFKDIPYHDETVDMVSKFMTGIRKGYWPE